MKLVYEKSSQVLAGFTPVGILSTVVVVVSQITLQV